jgi:hypothetical protein
MLPFNFRVPVVLRKIIEIIIIEDLNYNVKDFSFFSQLILKVKKYVRGVQFFSMK